MRRTLAVTAVAFTGGILAGRYGTTGRRGEARRPVRAAARAGAGCGPPGPAAAPYDWQADEDAAYAARLRHLAATYAADVAFYRTHFDPA